ncbi:hypothetical protein HRR83_000161 [Exophiala dermatitidis]|uniref:AMP-activated protein kinase glycogen-binding domain-containing protein n=2 Tax=Exophiala dermatitidis TaxID=5970 RepID=H6C8H3_EXODN|nr:uncharacterized protein HMPREF1120_08364 [Exophiala dermatitidis NIH/UT8656]KAJ4523514.1 hypothetical protein HRR73_002697 [Exophiala dermatitidis]EHY60400.1 hypothetical protein HMPREF1120_08364 [Exophiala dermatitidis NIH/UT8656]KAJ4524553.1 hypothetical protein HRR75_000143 [Exophiala dermatitidis]KAJ4527408.1 hypothetical protein HRR74_000162 [Exophiala dermatitidis]KAJ4530972.1 hypothetical protein HRR76_008659 [Exophiala dermatitidis]
MAPTTLVTFLVRTPASTRSVDLYGSWDNFSAPYPMQRDARTGPEHWSGCHSFANIICDGDLQSPAVPREGGLKMGGTYWYYYKLNDDIEYHNPAEPSTTACPLLPGQLVNVLNVPLALSSSRPRNDSVSSTSSEFRTMDPTDKFMNPRPVPAKPALPRLNTSPTLPQNSWSSSSSPMSTVSSSRGGSASSRGPPNSSSSKTLRVMRVTKKASFHRPSRSTSRESHRSIGIIGAFRALTSPRTASLDAITDRGRTTTASHDLVLDVARGSSKDSATSKNSAIMQPPPTVHVVGASPSGPSRTLALRREFDDVGDDVIFTLPSFGHHRRQRSTSRELSSLRNSLSLEESPVDDFRHDICTPQQRLGTLKEVASNNATPVWPVTALRIESVKLSLEKLAPPDLGKRLPTLPNTPSSAYPPSAADDSPPLRLGADIEALGSRFSSTTIDTESCTDSYIHNEQSRFSDWTCSTTKRSPRSAYAPSICTDFDMASPLAEIDMDSARMSAINVIREATHQQGRERRHSSGSAHMADEGLPSALSFSTVSSMASSNTPTSGNMDFDGDTDAELSWADFQHYSLPNEMGVEPGVATKLTSDSHYVAPLVVDDHHDRVKGVFQPHPHPHPQPNIRTDLDGAALPHSTCMQQLLDELSYLSGMIQQT